MAHQTILVLDFGSQVTQLIARRVREAHVYSEVHPCDVSDDWVRAYAQEHDVKGVILSGSHASTYEAQDLRAPQAVFELGVPVLGICYGMFTMAVQQGGQVEASTHREFGYAEVRAHGHAALLDGIEDTRSDTGDGMLGVWMSHGDKVTALPPGFALMASTPSCPIAGMADDARRFYGVQFHPEVTHTRQGAAILERFVVGICGATPDWVMRDHISEAVATIRRRSAMKRSSWGSRAAWTRASPRRSSIVPSATSSRACSWITGCCVKTKAAWSWRCSPGACTRA